MLRVGDVRVPHVAHISIRGHGADADWVAFTLAALERMTGKPVTVLGDEPLTVLAGTTPFVLVSSTWSARIAGAVRAAAARAGRPPVLVVRASRLPARVLPVAVHSEQRPRWGLRASPELVAGLAGAAHVLAAPDPPRDDVNVTSRTDVPVWGARWLGVGVEGGDGRLDWRHLSPTPVVAIDLDDAHATRALRAIASPTVVRDAAMLGAADTTAPAPPGQEVDGVLVGGAGPRVYCHWCRTEQTVADGLNDAAFSQLTDGLDDNEAYGLLERQTIGFCIYESCPRCGGPIHTT